MKPSPSTHLQSVILTVFDTVENREFTASFSGPFALSPDEDRYHIRDIKITHPRPLPKGASFEEIGE